MPELDGLRALAILPVVLFHAALFLVVKAAAAPGTDPAATGSIAQQSMFGSPGGDPLRTPLGWVVSHGFLGVQLFFAISGFVVTLPFARHFFLGERRPSFGAFYGKRVTRIEPPYLIAVALFALGVWLTARENFRAEDFLAGVVYLRTAIFGDTPWAFFISWSLEIEVQFYLLVPLLASIFAMRNPRIRRCVLLVAIIIGSIYAAEVRLAGSEAFPLSGPRQHGHWLGSEIAFFLIGMLVADLWTSGELAQGTRRSSVAYDAFFLGGIAAILGSYRALEASAWGISLLPLGLFALLIGALRGRFARAVLSLGIVSVIGGACYTIYLLHFLVVSAVGRFLVPAMDSSFERTVLLLAVPLAVATTAFCLALFPIVERPFMFADWPQRLMRAVRHGDVGGLAGLFRASREPTSSVGRSSASNSSA